MPTPETVSCMSMLSPTIGGDSRNIRKLTASQITGKPILLFCDDLAIELMHMPTDKLCGRYLIKASNLFTP